jgi:hypothetical protein
MGNISRSEPWDPTPISQCVRKSEWRLIFYTNTYTSPGDEKLGVA